MLLVGPAAPPHHAVSIAGRFTEAMFSSPSPERFIFPKAEANYTKFLDGQAKRSDIDKIKSDIHKPIADMNEPKGNAVGFFEQGLFTGMAVEAALVVSALIVCARYALPKIIKK